MGDRCQLGHGLERAGFIVGSHHGDEDGVCIDDRGKPGGIHPPLGVNGQDRHPDPVKPLQGTTCLQYGRMFGRLRYDMRARATRCEHHTPEGQQIGLRSGTGEHDLLRTGANQGSHLFSRLVQRLARSVAVPVRAGGISEVVSEERHQRSDHARVDRSRGVVVQVHGTAYQAGMYRYGPHDDCLAQCSVTNPIPVVQGIVRRSRVDPCRRARPFGALFFDLRQVLPGRQAPE